MTHGLIFDLDGTLVDSLPGITASLNQALAAHGFPTHLPAAVRGFVGNGSHILVTRATPPGSPEELIDAIEHTFKSDYDKTWPQGTIAYEGIHTLLGNLQLAGHRLAVLSNKPHPFTVAIVEQLFSGIHFDHIQGQLPGIPHKPDPIGAILTSRKLDLTPSDCIFIGDSTIDLETAKNAGMKSLAVTWGYHDKSQLTAAGPDAIAEAPFDIPSLIHDLKQLALLASSIREIG